MINRNAHSRRLSSGKSRALGYLIVQVQVVEFPVAAEVLHAPVQGEVDAPALALDDHGVPVVIIQQTARPHGRVAVDGAKLVASWITGVEKKQGDDTVPPPLSRKPVIYTATADL